MHVSLLRPLSLLAALGLLAPTAVAGGSIKPYGKGTAGSGGKVPALWASSTPGPGSPSFALRVENGLGGASGVVLVAGRRASVNVGGLGILIDTRAFIDLPPFTLAGAGAGNGTARVPLPLPNLPGLVGASVHAQGFLVDRGGAFIGIAATQG